MAAVMIGVDPDKASHTAVAVGAAEEPLGELRVRACVAQSGCWPGPRPGRSGPGQWRAPAEPATCWPSSCGPLVNGCWMCSLSSARVRLLAAGDVNKNDPNDARSVAIAALRSAGVRDVRPDDHAAVLKIWSKRHKDLGRPRTQVACRLHAVLGELIPGGVPKAITTARAARILRAIRPEGAVQTARCELAAALLDDLRRSIPGSGRPARSSRSPSPRPGPA
jgi:transposase